MADKLLVRDRPTSAAGAPRAWWAGWRRSIGTYCRRTRGWSALNGRLRGIAERTGAGFIERTPLQCDPARGRCLAMSDGLDKAIYDYGHLTLWGARQAADRGRSIGWFQAALRRPPGS